MISGYRDAQKASDKDMQTYDDLIRNQRGAVHSTVYHGVTDTQWHVTSFRHLTPVEDVYGDYLYEVQVWAPKADGSRGLDMYRKCDTVEEAEREHVRCVREILAGTYGRDEDGNT